VVVLKIWEAMTFAQIADVLEISADTAASRYRYAMQKLALKLDRAEGKVPHA
jgi:RNA polymerase sigma-70 factor (ECF subfamily)